MTPDTAARLVDFAGDEYPATIREDYSGHGMYGKTTVAVVFDHGITLGQFAAVVGLVAASITGGTVEVCKFLREVEQLRTDAMGRAGIVIY